MDKIYKFKCSVLENTRCYKAVRREDGVNSKIYVFGKLNDSVYVCDKYKILGSAILDENNGTKFYTNCENMQMLGRGKVKFLRVEVESWETKVEDGEEITKIKYVDELDRNYVRYIDQDGNLHKNKEDAKKKIETVTV